MKPEEIVEILRLHEMYLNGDGGGEYDRLATNVWEAANGKQNVKASV